MPHIPLPDGLPGIRGPMAFRPETAKPLNELANILLHGPHSLTPGERELIATYVSSENDCRFCQTVHGAFAAYYHGGDEALVQQVKTDPERAAVTPKLKALLNIAGKTAESGKLVTARGHRARPPGRRDGPRDPRHGPDRRLLLPLQPLRGRPGDRHARLARVLPRARAAGGPVRLHDVDLGARHAGRPLTDAAMADERSGGPGAATLDERSIRYEGWGVAAAAALGMFVSFASVLVYTFGIFLKPIAETFAWSREAVSAAFGFAAMTAAVCAPLTGMLLNRFGPRRVIVPCLIVFGGAYASLSLLTPHLAHLYALFVVFGLIAMGTSQVAYSRAISTWFQARLGAALAFGMCGSALGAMVLPPIAQRLIDALGWRAAATTIGVAVVVIGVPTVLAFVRERPGTRTADGRGQLTGATVGEGLRDYRFWILVVVLFSISIAQNGAITHLSALLTDRGIPAGARRHRGVGDRRSRPGSAAWPPAG